jgi:DNA-binding response OmpR family regulator
MNASSGQARILVVDDDQALRTTLVDYIERQGMRGIHATSGSEMTLAIEQREPDLVLLDLRLQQEDGLDLLRDLRLRSDIPVIIATGHRRDEVDRVVGLELGADDYLTKPFGLRELVARIRAILRRREIKAEAARKPDSGGTYRFHGWTFSRRSRRLLNPAGAPVGLTKGECALLIAFLESPQRPLSREHLLQATRVHEDIFDRSIDVQILRLRRKLDIDPDRTPVIRTVRGVGYVFTPQVERS